MTSTIVKLAFKNLGRNPRRTLVTGGGIAVGAAGILLLYGFVHFAYWGLAERFARSGNGQIQIADGNWFRSAVPEAHRSSKANLEVVADKVRAQLGDQVEALSLRRKVSGIVSTGSRSEIFVGTAFDPATYRRISASVSVVAGKTLSPTEPQGVILGRVLAKRIEAKPGDNISLLVTTDRGVPNAMDATVIGISASDSKELDAVSLTLSLPLALNLMETDQVDSLAVGLKQTSQTMMAEQKIDALLQGTPLETRRWDELADYYRSVKALYGRIFSFVELVLFVLTILAVANTVMMALLERRAELALLQAIGMRRHQIAAMIVCEGLGLGFGAGLTGILIAFAFSWLVQLWGGIPMPPAPGSSEGYRLNFLLDYRGATMVLGIAILSPVIASLWGSRRMVQSNIATALSGGIRSLVPLLLLPVFFGSATPAAAAGLNPDARLRLVDSLRAIPDDNFILQTTFMPLGEKNSNPIIYRVAGKGDRYLAIAISESAGNRMVILSSDAGMWMQKQGMRKPMRISPSQRLLGQASTADVVNVRWGSDYFAESYQAPTLRLVPKSTTAAAAYSKIELDFPADSLCPQLARFYARSGKLLKIANYEYQHKAGKLRLVSAIIHDAIRTGDKTKVIFGEAHRADLGANLFNPQNLIGAAHEIEAR